MVIEYLKNLNLSLTEEQEKLSKQQKKYQYEIEENEKFIKLLKKESDSNYDVFSPRKNNKIEKYELENLNNRHDELMDRLKDIKDRLMTITAKIYELDGVIKVAEQQEIANKNPINENEYFKIKLLETQENERQRIARDLHDSTVQSLTGLVHKTELCSKLLDMDSVRCKLELSTVSKTIREIIQEMRQTIFNLRPMSFDDIGFDVTLERELQKIQSMGVIRTKYVVEGEPFNIKPVIGLTIFRLIQEACNNALKHADPSYVAVKIVYRKNSIYIEIVDDGKGFDLQKVSTEIRPDNSGFGLSGMRERIYLLSGQIYIDSKIGNGTKISIDIPIIKEEK